MPKSISFWPKHAYEGETVYTDTEYVNGLLKDEKVQAALYKNWRSYFEEHAGGVFFNLGGRERDIVQDTFVILWKKVQHGQISVKEGRLCGRGGKPFTSTLSTYMMAIAKRNNLENVKQTTGNLSLDETIAKETADEQEDTKMKLREIVASLLVTMSPVCKQILTLFYYNGLRLDEIMWRLNSYRSKDALKTQKNKCLNRLRKLATEQYNKQL
ncbi:MAG: sigma-70 family RNA polymerase sigma factor [Prevotellaceae bacterium]|nr:sigma-70 family RNA polymerase sigma factor [Prevotellaceae bacterium]